MSRVITPYQKQVGGEYMDTRVKQLQDAVENKKVTKYGAVNNSGRLAKSIHKEDIPEGYVIECLDYMYQMIHGRRGGTMPPVERIEQWIMKRGISVAGKTTRELAWAYAKKIKKEGTELWKQYRGGDSGIISDVMKDRKPFNEMRDKLVVAQIQEIRTKIISQFEKIKK